MELLIETLVGFFEGNLKYSVKKEISINLKVWGPAKNKNKVCFDIDINSTKLQSVKCLRWILNLQSFAKLIYIPPIIFGTELHRKIRYKLAQSHDFGTNQIHKQQKLRLASTYAQSRQSLCFSHTQSKEVEED